MLAQFFSPFAAGAFDELERLQRDIDQLLGTGPLPSIRASSAFPAVNIGATPDEFHVYVFAPGVAATDFELTMQQNVLTVTGKRTLPELGNGTWYQRERAGGAFRRVLTLPEDADPDRVSASVQDGILHLRIARRAESRPRRIEIQ
jgi:HSP20 family protein